LQAACAAEGIAFEPSTRPAPDLGIDVRMRPQFEEKVLEHRDGHYIVQDWMGNITEISDQYDVTYIRSAKDFVTRKWHKFPVETAADFTAMQRRYEAADPGRWPADFATRVAAARDRETLTTVFVPGPFWQMREWCGFEPLCLLFVDQPKFVAAMVEFWSDYVSALLTRALATGVVDRVHVSEDMAYKGASMVSPRMARKFLLPVWKRWGAIVRNAGVPVFDMDSDGNVAELIPLWIEAGFNLCDPLEVAAGCDVVALRKRFGRSIAFSGGIDKRAMARGGADLEAELDRIEPIVRSGGYLPGCDHAIPPDVTWTNLRHFVRRWAQMCGWSVA
jgi:uroporphyrinogen decarboxylase